MPLNHIAHASAAPLYLGLGAILATVAVIGLAGTTLFSSPLAADVGADTPSPAPSPTSDPIYRKVAELQVLRLSKDLTPRPTNTPDPTVAPTMTIAPALPDCDDLLRQDVTVPTDCTWGEPTQGPPPTLEPCSTPQPFDKCQMIPTAQPPTSGEVVTQ